MALPEITSVWIREIPDSLKTLKTQALCNEAMCIDPRSLAFIPDCFRRQGMCNEAVHIKAIHAVICP